MTNSCQVLVWGHYFCDFIYTGLPEFPSIGTEIYSSGFEIRPGGCFTTALALHYLGVDSRWACDFGNDYLSQYVLTQARSAGLNDELFFLHDFPIRRITTVFSFPQDRAFTSFMDDCVQTKLDENLSQLHPAWLLLPHLHFGAETAELFTAARQAGVKIFMDCQHTDQTLDNPEVAAAIHQVDVFAPNLSEALQLTKSNDPKIAMEILSSQASMVVIKMGAVGAKAQSDGQVVHAPAIDVQVVDTTGAGDCFNVGFLYGLLQGYSLSDCLRCANICGGLSTRGPGSSAVPLKTEFDRRFIPVQDQL